MPRLIKELDPKEGLNANTKFPAVPPGENASTTTLSTFKSHGVTISNVAPTSTDDETQGFWNRWIWVVEPTEDLYLLVDETANNAVWVEVSPDPVTGLTNPLSEDLNAAGYTIKNVFMAGFRDTFYNLESDPLSLISDGTVELSELYNAYYYPGLSTELDVVFPTNQDAFTFGILTISLLEGGKIRLPEDVLWEKEDVGIPNPVIPSAVGSTFSIRYRQDPLTNRHIVSLSHLVKGEDEEEPVEPNVVEYVADSIKTSNLSTNNRNIHEYTYNYTSTVQDGSTYLIVGFISDGSNGVTTAPGWLTEIVRTPVGSFSDVHTYWGYYKPTQGNLDTGSVLISFTKNDEVAQIVGFEVTGARESNPVGTTVFNRSTQDRTSIPSVPITTTIDGSLLVSGLGVDVNGDFSVTQSVTTANGFTSILNREHPGGGNPSGDVQYIISIQETTTAGTFNTPVYARSPTGRAQMEAFSFLPKDS